MADNYTVTAQTPDIEMNDAGSGFVNGWKISYKVTSGAATGATGTLFVSNDNHNAEYVGREIAAKVSDLAEIAQLGK